MKTKSLPTQKSSLKHISKMTHGFGRADNPYWLRKCKKNTEFVPTGKSSPKHLPKVTRGFEALAAPFDSEKVNETTFKGDAWIRHRPQPLSTQKLSTKTKSLSTQKSPPKQLSKVTRGFRRVAAPVDSEKVNENGVGADWEIVTEKPSKGEAWIRKRSQPLLIKKKSTKQLPKMMSGFVSVHSRCRLRNIQRTLSHCRLRNHHRNNFQRWRVDSKELTLPVDSGKFNKNGVVANWEILKETHSKGDAWIRKL